jgi:LysR family transcriptional regulator, glycine cleavage system transcriptional activator
MQRRMPLLNALRAFQLAARLGSFKAAALEASATYGAISRHVRLLEDWIGAPLFLRHNRHVVLTELGRAYLAEIAPAFRRIARATHDARNRRRRKLLRVNALSTFTVRWLLPRFPDFRACHPEIDVDLTTSSRPVDVAGEAADIIIRGGPDTIYGFVTRTFLAETRQPVCNPVLLERLPLGEPADLQAHTLLHSSNMARLWDEWLAFAGVPGLEVAGNVILKPDYFVVAGAQRYPSTPDSRAVALEAASAFQPSASAAGSAADLYDQGVQEALLHTSSGRIFRKEIEGLGAGVFKINEGLRLAKKCEGDGTALASCSGCAALSRNVGTMKALLRSPFDSRFRVGEVL